MSVALADVELPNPLMTASGCAANGKELHRVLRRRRARRVRHQVGDGRPAVRPRHPADGRDPERDAQLDRAAGPGDPRLRRERPGVAEVGRRPRRWSPSPAAAAASTPTWPPRCARPRPSTRSSASRSTSPAPTSPTAAWSSPCDPLASAKVVALVREQLPRDIPIFAKLSPDVTDIVEVATAVRQGRRRRPHHDQHPAGHGDRHRPAAAAARRRHRRAVRARRSARSPCGPSGRCARRCPRAGFRRCRSSASGGAHRRGRPRAGGRRRQRRPGRYGDLQRPERARSGSSASWPSLLRGTGVRPPRRRRRRRARAPGPAPRAPLTAPFGARLRPRDGRARSALRRDRPAPRACWSAWGLPETCRAWRRSR